MKMEKRGLEEYDPFSKGWFFLLQQKSFFFLSSEAQPANPKFPSLVKQSAVGVNIVSIFCPYSWKLPENLKIDGWPS